MPAAGSVMRRRYTGSGTRRHPGRLAARLAARPADRLDPAGRRRYPGTMHVGVAMFQTDYAIRPDDLARALEERGYESLWFPEHTHIPVSRRSPWPGGPTLPKE